MKRSDLSPGEVAFCEYLRLKEAGEAPSFAEFAARYPGMEDELARLREGFEVFRPLADELQRQMRLFSVDNGEDAHFDGAWTELHAGDLIGEFRLIRPLGHGGMGEVWEAEQGSLERRLALKLILPHRVNGRALSLFAREARAGGRLAHPGIVTVHGTGEDGGHHWISMELVAGGRNLSHFIEEMDLELETEPDQHVEVARLIAAVADAVAAAHGAQVIHRDLKPSNILLTPEGEPKITDFGLAKITDELSISMAGELMGTYFYMSPEQVATKRAGLDARTDIFSLGVILYEMLSHQKPFVGDTTQQVMQKIMWETEVDPREIRSQVPRDMAVICAKAMEKQPDRRYSTMGALAADLRRFLNHEPIEARPPSRLRRVELWGRRHPALATAGAVLFCASLVLSAVSRVALRGWEEAETANAELLRRDLLSSSELVLMEQADSWPPIAVNASPLQEMIGRVEDLIERLDRQVESAAGAGVVYAADGSRREVEERSASMADLLERLRRLHAAADADRRALEGAHGDLWADAGAKIAVFPRYRGMQLAPQTGLVPLGPDPESGLWEFAVPSLGEVPERDSGGRLGIGPDEGLVLVLIPGGTFMMGGRPGEKTDKTWDEYPAHEVTLAPFFLSKYEMSRNQYDLISTGHRSTVPLKRLKKHDPERLWPVDSVTWEDARSALKSVGLTLPTEAQWEHAARGGAAEPLNLAALDKAEVGQWANIADKSVPVIHEWQQEEDVDDGYHQVAPADAFRPNGYGLHNTLGNLWEWTLDGYYQYRDVVADGTRRDGETGAVSGTDPRVRWSRGGSHKWPIANARISNRRPEGFRSHIPDMGLRPARAVETR